VQCHIPPLLYPYLYQCYKNPSTLFFGDHLISSSVGAQQGDPCGPMIFSLAIQPIILSLNSQLFFVEVGSIQGVEWILVSCVPQKTHSQQAMTKVKCVLV
jgi:hypothetical protein